MYPSLYIHIPVCLSKCDYCDFFSIPISSFLGEKDNKFTLLTDALLEEIRLSRQEMHITDWKTVYIGGGTPSLIDPANIARLGTDIMKSTEGVPIEEFTIEANPEDLTKEWLEACEIAGINRLSLGIQSMNDAVLSSVARRGSAESNRKALLLVKKYWKGRLSVDLISGLPCQTKKILFHDIDELLSYEPDHVSLYSLTIEDETPLARKIHDQQVPRLLTDEDADSLWISGRDRLENKGFLQYEISNFSRQGFESKHNLTYWNLDTYIGVGPGATGTVITGETAYRTTNTQNTQKWFSAPHASYSMEKLSKEDCIREFIMMGMRLSSGMDRKKFKNRFAYDVLDYIEKTVSIWERKQLINLRTDFLALTREGLLLLNRFLADCFVEIDQNCAKNHTC
jgi:oxygen-independent coproporphyrinogen III oxidase